MEKKKTDLNGRTLLITGAEGLIGANLIKRLLQELNGSFVIGIDNLNDYYTPDLKEYRLLQIKEEAEKQNGTRKNTFLFRKNDISNRDDVEEIFTEYRPSIVVNFAE